MEALADFSTLGALVGLVIAIVLIIKKVHPAYSLILGALLGGIIGGGGLVTTVNTMVSGAQSMMSSVLRIMTSGILAGALIKTGSAQKNTSLKVACRYFFSNFNGDIRVDRILTSEVRYYSKSVLLNVSDDGFFFLLCFV